MMKNKTGFYTLLSLCLFLLTLLPSYSMQQHHTMHSNKSVPAACIKKDSIPTLACAPTTSSHFDNNGKLWVAWYNSGHIYII